MKRKAFVSAAILLFAVVAASYAADDVFMGSWKLNEAKSKIAPSAPKNSLVVYSADGNKIKVAVDGTGPDGSAIHSEWTGKFDGKYYPVTGDPSNDMRAYRQVNAHTVVLTDKKDGKVVNTIRVVVSADGKTRTVTITGMDAKGMKSTSTEIYEKQ